MEDINYLDEFLKQEIKWRIEDKLEYDKEDLTNEEIEGLKSITDSDIEEIKDKVVDNDYLWELINDYIDSQIDSLLE